MTEDTVARVHWSEHQYLGPQDFSDEQEYHVAMRRRHLVGGHNWGVVSGLEVVAAGRQVYVEPGLAVDGYGREIVLAQRGAVAPPVGAAAFDVWIAYDRVGSDTRSGPCGPGDDAFHRWQEVARLQATEAREPVPRPLSDEVAPEDREFGPERTAPEARRWPVFLARVRYDLADNRNPFEVDGSARRWAGLVGATVRAPSGGALLRLGPGGFAVEDPREPATAVVAAQCPLCGQINLQPDEDDDALPRELFRVDATGTFVGGALTVHGALGVRDGVGLDAVTKPTTAQPWTILRTRPDGEPEQVRIELEAAGPGAGAGPGGAFVVGAWSADEDAFVPALTVNADGTVTVAGTLRVEGEYHEVLVQPGAASDDQPAAALDPEADRLVTAAMLGGMTAAGGLAVQLYTTPGAAAPPVVPLATAVAQPPPEVTDALASVMADALAGDAGLPEALARELLARHEDAARALRERLGEGG